MADWQLVRVDPADQRGEGFDLEPTRRRYVIGRSRACDVALYTGVASRQHAELLLRDDGTWIIRPLDGRTVLADGEAVEGECELCEGLSLVLGKDRLRCMRPTAVSSELAVPPHARRWPWALAALLALCAGGYVWLRLTG